MMKRVKIYLLAAVLMVGFSGIANAQSEAKKPTYVGSKKCKMCHGKLKMGGVEYLKWAKSAHAKAFTDLATPAAKEQAAKLGVTEISYAKF